MQDKKAYNTVMEELDNMLQSFPKEGERKSEEDLQKDTSSDKQKNVGKEQSEEAKANNGSTAPDKKPKRNKADEGPEANKGTTQMDADDKAEEKSEGLGKVKKEEMNMEQKQAAVVNLGEGIIDLLEKDAGQSGSKKAQKQVKKQTKTASQNRNQKQNLPEGVSEEQFNRMVKTAQDKASQFGQEFLIGMVKRAQDERWVKQAMDEKTLKQYGGAGKLLDKLAQENPEAVMPPEMVEEGGAPAEGAPAEGEPAEGGGDEEAYLDEIAQAMEDMGVTPETMDQSIGLIEKLREEGYSDEEIAQAAAEMLQEEAGAAEQGVSEEQEEAPVEESPEEPEEAPEEEAPAEELSEEEEKVAAQQLLQKIAEHRKSKGSNKEALKRKLLQSNNR